MPEYELYDTRTLKIQVRLMITNNEIDPNCYMISKVLDMFPPGIIKISAKADDFNPERDNVELRVCDYYLQSGDIVEPQHEPTDPETSSSIHSLGVNDAGELVVITDVWTLDIGTTYYYVAHVDSGVECEWRVELLGDYTETERLALEKLITLRPVNSTTTMLKTAKSNKIKGKTFRLSVCDKDGNYPSYLDLEVSS